MKTELTPREVEVTALVAAGYTNAAIASELRISFETVKRHLSNIFDKRGVDTRTELTAWWLSHHSPEVVELRERVAALEAELRAKQGATSELHP